MARNTEKEHFCGKMIAAMRANLSRTTFMVLVNIFGKMAELIKVNGRITRWMEKEYLHG